jgi:tetratricopeptide (TPR) repeat protein
MLRKILGRLCLFNFILCLCFLNSLSAQAQTKPTTRPTLSEAEKKGVIGRDLIFHRKYDEAMIYFKKMAEEDSHSPLGSFGQMAVWQARMFENYDFRFDKEYTEVSEMNKKVVEEVLDQKDPSAWDLFLAGASSGLHGFYLMRKGSVFKALGEAGTAKKALNHALEKDPSFADVYLGLGMFDFWRSVFTNRFRFLPFFSDKRAQGLAEMEKSIQEGRVVGPLAEASLAYCYYENRDYQKAIPLLEHALKNYPENVLAKNLLSDFYLMKGNFNEAHRVLEDVMRIAPEAKVAKFFQGRVYFRENNFAEARKWFEDFLATQPNNEWTSYALTELARIDLKEGKEDDAYEKFKKAYRIYPDYSLPLKELQKLRKKRW